MNNFTSAAGAKINIDADLSSGASDNITAGTASGELAINAINVIKDGSASSITLFKNGISPTLGTLKTFTGDAIYTFSQAATAGVLDINKTISTQAGLHEAIADTSFTRAFSATRDVEISKNLGWVGGESGATLTIFGNGYNINGNGFNAMQTTSGKTINIYNAGSVDSDGTILSSINGFAGTNYGSFIDFSGENNIINIVSSVFTNNTSKNVNSSTGYNAGGVIRNYQGKLTISDSVFKDNFIDDTKSGFAGAVYSGSGKTDIINTIFDSNYVKSDNFADGGALAISGSSTITNSIFKNNYAEGTNTAKGGAIYVMGIDTLTISGSTFSQNETIGTNSRGGAIFTSSSLVVKGNTTFTSNTAAEGGAIYVEEIVENDSPESKLTVESGVIFDKNTANYEGGAIFNVSRHENTITGATFTSNEATNAGGAIANYGKLTITDSTFGGETSNYGNSSPNGGAIYNTTYNGVASEIALTGSNNFNNNYAASNGGAIYNHGIMTIGSADDADSVNTFKNNESGINGGAIYNTGGGELTISGTNLFESNSATTENGGAIYNIGALTINEGSTFVSNSANESGGAIYSAGSGNNTIKGATFKGNSAGSYGGAIYNSSNLTISSSTFGGNADDDANIAYYGGAITNNGGILTIENTSFVGNKTKDQPESYGGAIYQEAGSLTIKSGTEFINNSAKAGGAIFINNTTDGSTNTITGAVFKGNKATDVTSAAGAIYIRSSEVTITDTIFGGTGDGEGNTANSRAGAIYITRGSAIAINGNSSFINNSSGGYGGAIMNTSESGYEASTLTISGNVAFSGNTAVSGGAIMNLALMNIGSGTTFANNIAHKNGGAINNASNLANTITGATFTGNKSLFEPTDDTENVWEYGGGAIYNAAGSNITISDSTFGGDNAADGNTAYIGGAIYNKGTLTLSGANVFKNNNAGKGTSAGAGNGGAIVSYNGTATIGAGTQFISNSAFQGGALYTVGGTYTIEGTLFQNNIVSGHGGAINSGNKGNNIISDAIFIENKATHGGAIYNLNSTLSIDNSTFTGNQAARGGAIANIGTGDMTLTDNVFGSAGAGNFATRYGGAIYNEGTLAIVSDKKDTIFTDNTATEGGNDIYSTGTLTFKGTMNTNITGGIAGSGTINKEESGILNLKGVNSGFGGTTNINDGKILYTKASDSDSYLGGTTKINTGGTLEFNIGADLEDSINGNIISTTFADKTGTFLKTGAGTVVLNADNSLFSGSTEIQSGTIRYLQDDENDKYFTGTTLISTGAQLVFDLTNHDETLTSSLSGTGDFIKNGENTLIIDGNDNSPFSGTTYLNEGKIKFNKNTASDRYFAGETAIKDGAELEFNIAAGLSESTFINASGNGDFRKTGSGTLDLTGDNSGFTGDLFVDEGLLTFTEGTGKAFFDAASINIQNSGLEYTYAGSGTFEKPVNLGGSGTLSLFAGSAGIINVNSPIAMNGANNTINLNSGSYIFGQNINTVSAADNNKLVLNNTTLGLTSAVSEFGSSVLNAEAENSHIDLRNEGIGNVVFDNLTLNGANNSLSIDIDLMGNKDQHSPTTPDPISDKLTANSGSGTINLANVAIIRDGEWYNKEIQVVDAGDITLESFDSKFTAFTSGGYVYDITNSQTDDRNIVISTTDYNVAETLKKAHMAEGDRSFTIQSEDPYRVLSNLETMGKGEFTVNGAIDTDGNRNRVITGNGLWELFNVDSTDGETRTLNINNVEITGAVTNTRDNGAAIAVDGADSTVNIHNAGFTNNTANNYGGAIYNNGGKISIENSDFTGNTAANGGAIYSYNTTEDNKLTINQSSFTGNTSNGTNGGGAILLVNGFAEITNTNFIQNNTSSGSGGAIKLIDSTLNLTGGTFDGNFASANSGGAIYVSSNSTLNIDGTKFINNYAQHYSDIDDNGDGGALAISGTATIKNSYFENNKAIQSSLSNDGGAIISGDNSNITIESSIFKANVAESGGGGAIYNKNILSVSDSTFAGNSAGAQGGALFNSAAGNMTLTDNIFGSAGAGNSATEKGGAIYNEGTLTIVSDKKDTIFTANTAAEGNDIYNAGTLTFKGASNTYITGGIAGTGTINKQESGILSLKGVNSGFTGTTNINDGKILFDKTASTDTYFSGTTNISSGSVLEFKLGAVENLVGENKILGSGQFIKTGAANLNISGANDQFSGTFTAGEGTVNYNQTVENGWFGGMTEVLKDAVLNITNASDDKITLKGNGTVNKTGAGTLKLTGDNSGFAKDYSALNINGGKLDFTKASDSDKFVNSIVSLADNTELSMNLALDEAIAGNIKGTANSTLRKTGSADLLVSGDNSIFNGTTIIENGNIVFTKEDDGDIYFGGKTQIGAGSQLVYELDIEETLHGANKITGEGEFVKKGADLTVDGQNNAFTGGVVIESGKISYAQSANGSYFGGSTTLKDNTILDFTNSTVDYIHGIQTDGTLNNGEFNKYGGGEAILNGNNADFGGTTTVYDGTLTYTNGNADDSFLGGQILVKNDAELKLNLNSAETIGGNISGEENALINKTGNAQLTVNGDNSGFDGTLKVSGGTLKYEQTAGGSYFNGKTQIESGASLEFNNSIADETIKAISGTGSFTKTGSNTLEMTGDNSGFSGNMTISGGTIKFNDLNNKFVSSPVVNIAGSGSNQAKLEYTINGASSVTNQIALGGNAEFELSGIANASGDNRNRIEINNEIQSSGDNNTFSLSNGTFIFNDQFTNFGKTGSGNSLNIDNSTIELGNGISNFGNSSLNADINNSVLNLANNGSIDDLVFNELNLGTNVSMTIDLDLKDNPDQGSHVADPEADMITYNNGSGTLKIENVVISQDGQWKDTEIQVLEGDGITLDMNKTISAATSEEYEYAIQKSTVAGHENTHIQITTTDYISDPTADNYSLKRMHTRTSPDPTHEISETRSFSVVNDTPYKVLSNLDKMAEGTFSVNGGVDADGNVNRVISGNNLWSLFNADSTDPADDGERILNINNLIIKDATTANDTRKDGAAVSATGANSEANLTNSYFETNKAEGNGGAVYVDGSKLSVNGGGFTGNEAGLAGGAIYNTNTIANPDAKAEIANADFSQNKAQNGGAIYNDASMNITNVNITKNEATNGSGGAIINSGTTTIKNANINENTAAEQGGAISNSGTMNIENAVLKGNSAEKEGGAIANSSDLTLTDVSFENNSSKVNGGAIFNTGNLTINSSADQTMTFQNNTANGVKNDIYTTNGLTVNADGNVNILSGLAGSGTLEKNGDGILNISGVNENYAGDVQINDGTLVFHKQNSGDSYVSGSTNIEADAKLVYNLAAEETVDGNIKGSGTFIKQGTSNLTISGKNDGFTGGFELQQGNATYLQTDGGSYFGGTTTLYDNTKLTYVNGSDDNITGLIGSSSSEFVKQGAGTLNATGDNSGFYGKVSIEEGILNYVQTDTSKYFGGETSIGENTKFLYTSNNDGTNNVETVSKISGKGDFVKEGTGSVKLTGDMSGFEGKVEINDGKLVYNKTLNKESYIKGETIINENGELEFCLRRDETLTGKITGNGTFTKTKDSTLTISGDQSGFTGTVNLNEGTIALGKGAQFFGAENFNMAADTLLDLRNTEMNRINLGNLNLAAGSSNLGLDINLQNSTGDFISASSVSGEGSLVIKYLNVISDCFYPGTTISVIDTANGLSGKVSLDSTLNRVMGPIYQYAVSYNPNTGNLSFAGGQLPLDSRYNPAVLMPQVAAQIGGYLTQLQSYDDAFANMDMLMLLPRAEREALHLKNRYAAADSNIVFTPTMIPEERAGTWFRPFSTFESVPLKNGPTVSNVAYGGMMGADSEIKHLKHGVDAVFSAYVGYNGSHQTALGTSIYQNGGVLGGTAAFYKGNFFSGWTANIGASQAELSAMFGKDDFTMLTAGVATKSGYNWELFNNKFIIQPNYMMSYTFVNTYDYYNSQGVRISSDPLNAIQIAPGIKFIGNLKNGWQPYINVQVVINLLDSTKFKANVVSMPEMSVKPFVVYGAGVQKRWGERFTGFAQAMFRSGGRNGVGFNLGLRWSI